MSPIYLLLHLIIKSINAWQTTNYRLPGVIITYTKANVDLAISTNLIYMYWEINGRLIFYLSMYKPKYYTRTGINDGLYVLSIVQYLYLSTESYETMHDMNILKDT